MESRRVIAAALTIAILAVVLPRGQAAVSCAQVSTNLFPCLDYLRGRSSGNYPTQKCCNGVKYVEAIVKTPADKRDACNCVKDAASRYSDLKDDAARSLAGKCGVQLNIPISRNVDCTKVA